MAKFTKFAIFLSVVGLAATVSAAPVIPRPALVRRQGGLPGIGQGPQTATDGSVIVEDQVVINGLPIRFKVSAPANQLVANGGAAAAAAGNLGVNILFHGDGGQSFFDFPNQGVNAGLMGVALLSPDPGLRWGGSAAGDQTGLVRPDGVAHSAAVNQFITQVLPQVVNFDNTKIFMEGISGGSLMLSGFTIPAFGASLGVPGVVFGCGGLSPQVNIQGDISNIRVHWQSTVNELPDLQTSIPAAIQAYEQNAAQAGLNTAQINQLQTADASPNGGHCEFDEQDFVSGVQLLTDNFNAILSGQNNAAVGVVGNENLFAGATAGNQAAGNQAAGNQATGNQATGNQATTAGGRQGGRNGRGRNRNRA